LHHIQPDHLGTPRKVIQTSNNTAIWNWPILGNAFGEAAPTGTITLNLRFPGQYFDAETGLNYNYFRDYEPGTGRYVESDPIGLRGGVSTYGYVGGNALAYLDPLGLDRVFCRGRRWAPDAVFGEYMEKYDCHFVPSPTPPPPPSCSECMNCETQYKKCLSLNAAAPDLAGGSGALVGGGFGFFCAGPVGVLVGGVIGGMGLGFTAHQQVPRLNDGCKVQKEFCEKNNLNKRCDSCIK